MITASSPVTFGGLTYDGWRVARSNATVAESGQLFAQGQLVRCRDAGRGDGSTLALPPTLGAVPVERVALTVPDVFAPVGAYGAWWTEAVRNACLQAAAATEAAYAALGAAQGVL